MQEKFYTLKQLAARLNRSEVGVRTRLRDSGRIPRGVTWGGCLVWDRTEIEALIEADPSLVLPSEPRHLNAFGALTAALELLIKSQGQLPYSCLIQASRKAGFTPAAARKAVDRLCLAKLASCECKPEGAEILVTWVGGDV